ncbi:williams-beuren syndrome chromosomal region 27 protein [Stemphylium lycopersici]|nr:williams-beuren syndrome chromosomal region 27 protein [Stemphylium lycopersici]
MYRSTPSDPLHNADSHNGLIKRQPSSKRIPKQPPILPRPLAQHNTNLHLPPHHPLHLTLQTPSLDPAPKPILLQNNTLQPRHLRERAHPRVKVLLASFKAGDLNTRNGAFRPLRCLPHKRPDVVKVDAEDEPLVGQQGCLGVDLAAHKEQAEGRVIIGFFGSERLCPWKRRLAESSLENRKINEMTSEQQSHLSRVLAASTTEESRTIYEEWAKSYDADMTMHAFTAPTLVAQAVARGLKVNHVGLSNPLSGLEILDLGCGTGLVGVELSKIGATDILGLDVSEGMLAVAKNTAVYDDLQNADVTQKLAFDEGKFDAVTCCGMFTHGHLEPEVLEEFVRVVKTGGVFVATVLEKYWVERGFEGVVGGLEKEGRVEVVEKDVHEYRKDSGGGRLLLLRKL